MSKLPFEDMRKYVFSRTGAKDPDVLCGPAFAEDAAVIRLHDNVLVAHADPIVGAVKHIGRLSVHISCNDIAVRGVRPRWIMPVIVLPEKYSREMVDEITGDIHSAAREIGAAVVGGHLGYAAGLTRPLIATSAFGTTGPDEYVLTGNARPGDRILITKGAGIEGTAIIAFDFEKELNDCGVTGDVVSRARRMMNEISVVEESLELFAAGATSMHDATRGGVMEALIEVAIASGVRAEVEESLIPVREPTRVFAGKLSFDPLKLISSGTVVATIPPDRLAEVRERLTGLGVEFSEVGTMSEGAGVRLRRRNGNVETFDSPKMEEDELAELWKRYRS